MIAQFAIIFLAADDGGRGEDGAFVQEIDPMRNGVGMGPGDFRHAQGGHSGQPTADALGDSGRGLGHHVIFPYLIARASKYGLLNTLTFSRDGFPLHKCIRTFKGSGSYFSYGVIYYRPSRQFYLHGRLHIDSGSGSHAFTFQGLPGMIEVARVTLTPLQKVQFQHSDISSSQF